MQTFISVSLVSLVLALSAVVIQFAKAGSSTNTGSMAVATGYGARAILANGKVLVFSAGENADCIEDCQRYDPATGSWAIKPLTHWRCFHTITVLPNGKVLLVGGYDNDTGPWTETELFDPAMDAWINSGPLNIGRYAHTATLLPDGKVLVIGGVKPPGREYTASVELYNATNGTWSTNGSLITARALHTATLLPNGKVLVAGGSYTNDGGTTSSAELYDPGSGTAVAIVLMNPMKLANGSFQFSFTNTTGTSFTALATTNPTSLSSNWTALGSPTEISPGQFQFTDSQTATNTKRFYRVTSP